MNDMEEKNILIKEIVQYTLSQTKDEFEWLQIISNLRTKSKQYFNKIITNEI